jgi:hypothetical protein
VGNRTTFDIHHAGFEAEPLGAARCNSGPQPMLRARIKLALKMMRYASLRAAIGDFNAMTCYVTPIYSGGASLATVDGRLRFPMCFGGEAWAQTGALRGDYRGPTTVHPGSHCVDEFDALPGVLETVTKHGYVLAQETA